MKKRNYFSFLTYSILFNLYNILGLGIITYICRMRRLRFRDTKQLGGVRQTVRVEREPKPRSR